MEQSKKNSKHIFFTRNRINLDIHHKCTLECNKCARQIMLKHPSITKAKFPGCPITDSDWKKIADHFERINFCGQISDPIMHPRLSVFLNDMYKKNKYGNVHTAVSQKPIKSFIKCFEANPNMKWIFGIDGLPKDSHKYRINQDGEKLFNIMLEATKYVKVEWQYIVFNYNQKDIETAKKIALDNNIIFTKMLSGRFAKDDPLKPSKGYYVERNDYQY